ncbi:MAG: hypothetical protein ACI9TH_004526 [Kiritimatiellia bacterium]|jgi:hypothetical protein
MKLITDGHRNVSDPGAEDIRIALGKMEPGNDGFLILEKNAWHYIQCAGDASVGFSLEYQEGSLEQHYQVEGRKLDTETVLNIFTSYAARETAWRSAVPWTKMDLS